MYSMKSLRCSQLVENLPDVMYKMKKFHDGSLIKPTNIYSKENENQCTEMSELECRQKQILQQLAALKEQMLKIKCELKSSEKGPVVKQNAPKAASKISICHADVTSHPDIVINASPDFPPYSLLVCKLLCQNNIGLSIQSYVHSSLENLNQKAMKFIEKLKKVEPKCISPQLNIKLVWKNVGANMEIIISHLPILGEVNILRYLARLCGDVLNYETSTNVREIDFILDSCYAVTQAKTKKEQAEFLSLLTKTLDKKDWLFGKNGISIADVAAYSVIKQILPENETNALLKRWLERVENIA